MLVSIDIVFYGPQILIPYIMIVEAPLYRRQGVHAAWMPAYIAVPNLLSMISMGGLRSKHSQDVLRGEGAKWVAVLRKILPDPDPGLNKWPNISFSRVFNSILRNICCLTLFMNILFRVHFRQKKTIPEQTWTKIYFGQDPDPDISNSDPDSVKNRPDPQHCFIVRPLYPMNQSQFRLTCQTIPTYLSNNYV
jgi:hypothetical protein